MPKALSVSYTHLTLPTTDLEPNDAEKDLKNQIKLAAYLFDIELADYLLINNEDYYSFADNKVL